MSSTVFHMIPAGPRPFLILLPVLLLLGGVLFLLAAEGWASQHAWFELSPRGLRLHGGLYGRLVPAAELRVDGSESVDLAARSGLRPVSRRLGTGLPGYAGGWFRLANGEKALVYLTDRHRVVYVPTTRDYVLLLSVPDPDRLVAALRATPR